MRDNFNEDALPVEPNMHRSLLSGAAELGFAHKQHYNPADFSSLATEINDLSNILMVTELAEAFEGKRKNLMDSHLPHRKAVEVECADELIRLFDYAGENGFDLGGAILEKLEYNRTRADHSREARLGPNGKKF